MTTTTIDDLLTTQQIADADGYPVWAVRRAVDALGIGWRFRQVRAVPRSEVARIREWITARNIAPVARD